MFLFRTLGHARVSTLKSHCLSFSQCASLSIVDSALQAYAWLLVYAMIFQHGYRLLNFDCLD